MWSKFFLFPFLYSLFANDKKKEIKSKELIEQEIKLEREKFRELREFENENSDIKFKNNLMKLGVIVGGYALFLFYISYFSKEVYSKNEIIRKLSIFADKFIILAIAMTFIKIVLSSHKSDNISKISEIMFCLVMLVLCRIVLHFL